MSIVDVFKSFLVKNATYSGFYEIPNLKTTSNLPDNTITFTTALSKKILIVM